MKSVTITEADRYYNNKNTITAERVNINSKNWQLKNVSILNNNGLKNNYKSYVYNSTFNGEIISNLFSNLNSLNIYQLNLLLSNYIDLLPNLTVIRICY